MSADLRPITPDDEGRHTPTNEDHWTESWLFDVVHESLRLGATFELVLHPTSGSAAFNASVVGQGRKLVSLSEPEAAQPTPPGLEVRASGLWVDIGIQTPMHHVTVDVEAFAVELDDPDDVFRGAYGRRIPFGCELEWEMDDDLQTGRNPMSYEVPCVVHGELLIDDETIEIDGWGWRSHRWGVQASDDRAALRGRRRNGVWWSELNHPIEDVTTVGRAPVAENLRFQRARLDQRMVENAAGDLAWVRSVRI